MTKAYNGHIHYNISYNEIDELNKTIENIDALQSLSSIIISSNFCSSSSKEESEDESININSFNDKRNDSRDEEQNKDSEVNRGKFIKKSNNNSKKSKNKNDENKIRTNSNNKKNDDIFNINNINIGNLSTRKKKYIPREGYT